MAKNASRWDPDPVMVAILEESAEVGKEITRLLEKRKELLDKGRARLKELGYGK